MMLLLLKCGTVHADLFSDDGVLVIKGGDLRVVSGYWTGLVTIQPPQPPDHRLWLSSDHTRQFIEEHTPELDSSVVHAWIAHLDGISVTRDIPVDHMDTALAGLDIFDMGLNGRPRRGLFDAIGKLSRALFGTVMHSDIDTLRKAIDDTRDQVNV